MFVQVAGKLVSRVWKEGVAGRHPRRRTVGAIPWLGLCALVRWPVSAGRHHRHTLCRSDACDQSLKRNSATFQCPECCVKWQEKNQELLMVASASTPKLLSFRLTPYKMETGQILLLAVLRCGDGWCLISARRTIPETC